MPTKFTVAELLLDSVNPPRRLIHADTESADAVCISNVSVTVDPQIGGLWGAVLRASSVPPQQHPNYAKPALPAGPATKFHFGKLTNATAGPDNKLVLWAEPTAPGKDEIAQFPFVGEFYDPNASTMTFVAAVDALFGDKDKAEAEIAAMIGKEAAAAAFKLNKLLIILGGITILSPAEANPTPPNQSISPILGTPFSSIPSWVLATNGSMINAWALVMRASAPIPPMPFGVPNPVQATLSGSTIAYFAAVPGAVLGSDNKLVVWAQFLQEPHLTIATRAFCGT